MDSKARHRLLSTVDRLLLERGELDPLEYLLAIGGVDYADYREWRHRGLTASSPQPCRFPTRRAACHTCAQSSAHPSPHGARHARLQRQSSGVGVLSFAFSPSRTFLQ